MSISKIQGAFYNSSALAYTTATYANTAAVGNLLVAWGRLVNSTNGGVVTTGWTQAVQSLYGAPAGYLSIHYKVAEASDSKTVTLTGAGATIVALSIEEWGGLDASTPLDQTDAVPNTGSTVTSRSSGHVHTTVDNELLIAGLAVGNDISTATWSDSFSVEFGSPFYKLLLGSSRIVASTGIYNTTASWVTARLAAGAIASFKALTTSAAWVPRKLLLGVGL